MNEGCHNPLCSNPIESSPVSGGWRRTPKRFCSEQCKLDAWALKRVAQLLADLPAERKLNILAGGLTPNGNYGRKKIYQCFRWPSYSIRNKVHFQGGLFETDDPEIQKLIEASSDYGVHIRQVEGQQT